MSLVDLAVLMQHSVGTLADRMSLQLLLHLCPTSYQFAPYGVNTQKVTESSSSRNSSRSSSR